MNESQTIGVCVEDYTFGPQSSLKCRHGLDLTLVFEESMLSILPSSLMIVASIARVAMLRKSRRVASSKSFYGSKSLHLGLLVAVRLALLLLWTIRPPIRTITSIAAASISLVESFAFIFLAKSEHIRSVRPSSLLSLYYLVSLGFDFIRMRTLVIMQFDTLITSLAAADMLIKASLMFSEAQSKRPYFSEVDQERPPQETSSIFNRSLFWWLNSLFLNGYQKILTLKDLVHLDEELSSEETLSRFEQKWHAMSHVSNYRLGKTVVFCLRSLFLGPVIPNIIVMALTFAQPFLVTALLNFISSDDPRELGYMIVAGYAAVFIFKAVFTAVYTHQLDRFTTSVRGCLVNIIYNQTLKIDMKEAVKGDSLTLMSADVERIVKGFALMHDSSSNATMAIVALGLLYRQLGLSFLAPFIFSAVLSFSSGIGSAPYISRQKSWLEATEQRVSFTSSVISAMKGIKILGLVERVSMKLRSLRAIEVNEAKRVRLFSAIFTLLQTLSLSGTRWITYTTFGIITLLSSSVSGLNVTVLFTSLSILNIFMERLEIFLRNMPNITSAFGCLRRIEIFLLLETKRDTRSLAISEKTGFKDSATEDDTELQLIASMGEVISMKDLSVGWYKDQPVVEGLNLDIQQGSMTMIVGPVGSGKSTIVQAILGEAVTEKGSISVSSLDAIAFAAQTPWLINLSIQQNILGASNFDGPWYLEVLRACALLEDIKNYPAGDRTLIGSRGMTLSGGQKARIALARAVYSRKPIILLDDIFSGLDPVTEDIIFRSLFGSSGILRKASNTVILATHAVHFLSSFKNVILLGDDSKVIYQGSYAAFPPELVSMRELGTPAESADMDRIGMTEHLLAVDKEHYVPTFQPMASETDTAAPDISRQLGDSSIYKYYLATMGWGHILLFIFLGGVCMGFTPAQTLWLQKWADDTSAGSHIPVYLCIYSIFFVGEIFLTSIWIWHVLIYPLSASSVKLHDFQLGALLSATMSFFSTTDTGVTTNRFSQDLMLIDSELPLAMIDFVEYVYNNLYKMILIGISTAYVLPAYPPLLLAFWAVQRFYLRTSRQIRFIDLETKAPLYTHFIESLAGLSTIRGFGWEQEFRRTNKKLMQASQQPFFILVTIQRWLTLMLNLIVAVLAIVLAVVAVELRDSINPGLLGLALTNVLSLSLSLNSLVSFWTSLETSIGAVSRIKSFSEGTPSEDPHHLGRAPETWIHSGNIEIHNTTASHNPDSPAVLQDITLSVSPGQHIGICGRSGSGKSSLLSVLLRLLETTSGSVLIDGVDISSISINQVRGSLNTLSQETFFLRGTVRDNLATASDVALPDERLQTVLTRVGLWNKVFTNGGLDTQLDAEESFSHGERQLFALARALLNPSKILIFDEFTSNVDIDTDRVMQKIIREDFGDRTILAVAHRLDTIRDFDRVVVLDKGRLVEEGAPTELLGRESRFKGLYDVYMSERVAEWVD